MKKQDQYDNNHHDPDLQDVFDAMRCDVPADLDEKIIAGASCELTHSRSLKSLPYIQSTKHLMAMAAVLVLSIGIVPLLMQSVPTNTSNSTAETSVSSDSDLADDAEFNRVLIKQLPSTEKQHTISESATQAQGYRSELAPTTTSEAQNEAVSISTDLSNTRVESDYRATPKSWIAFIEKMLDDGELDRAKEELRQLRSEFPEFKIPDEIATD